MLSVLKKKHPHLPPYLIPIITTVFVALLFVLFFLSQHQPEKLTSNNLISESLDSAELIDLPYPSTSGRLSVESALNANQAYYQFEDQSLSLDQVSQMFWAGQGITTDWGGRTVVSPRSAYPLTLFLLATDIDDLEAGLYRYYPGDLQPANQLVPLQKGDLRQLLSDIVAQNSILTAPGLIIVTGDNQKIADRYDGQTFDSKMYLEAGQVAQNLYLQAESISLGVNAIDTDDDDLIKDILNLPVEEDIIYLIPFGYPQVN